MNLSQLQQERNAWIAHNFPDTDHPHTSVLGAVEEMLGEMIPLLPVWESLGRLAHAQIKAEAGIRGTPEELTAKVRDAVADAVIFLAGVATHHHFDFGEAVQEAWDEVKERDWVAYPTDGRTC